jgi:hypothetical protein
MNPDFRVMVAVLLQLLDSHCNPMTKPFPPILHGWALVGGGRSLGASGISERKPAKSRDYFCGDRPGVRFWNRLSVAAFFSHARRHFFEPTHRRADGVASEPLANGIQCSAQLTLGSCDLCEEVELRCLRRAEL